MAFGLLRGPHHEGAVRVGAALLNGRRSPPLRLDYHHEMVLDGDALGNDTIGNCCPAGELRLIQLRMANAWGSSWKPDTDQAIRLYSLVTGYDPITRTNDNGTYPAQMQAFLYRTGVDLEPLQDIEVAIPGAVDHTNPDAMRAASQAYGGTGLQFALPAAWLDMGSKPDVWDIPLGGLDTPAGKPGGGKDHFVVSGKYDTGYLYGITWGNEVPITWRAVAAYCIGASCGLERSWIDAVTGKTPSGLTYDQAAQLMRGAT